MSHCVFQPTQQLHDNEGGEKDGVHFRPEVSGSRAALPGGHVRNQEGGSHCHIVLMHDKKKN